MQEVMFKVNCVVNIGKKDLVFYGKCRAGTKDEKFFSRISLVKHSAFTTTAYNTFSIHYCDT
jgi:hypothetical protein